jgi:hypothetical protein
MLPVGVPFPGPARAAVPALLLLLASCSYPLYAGRDNYAEGMRRLRYDPGTAGAYFAEADRELAEAVADDGLDPAEKVLAVTLRARSLIELERHSDVAAVLSTDVRGYNADRAWRGDPVGLSLLRATKLDPERAYAELLLAEKKAATLRARLHIAWEQVHVLRRIGTPKAKAEAVKICEAHAGKLDFDTLKQTLSTP